MKTTPDPKLDKIRLKGFEDKIYFQTDYMIKNEGNTGVFEFREKTTGKRFFIISSITAGWEHVSVHIITKGKKNILPSWYDMCMIKDLFFDPEEVVVQMHPKKSEYVNLHPSTLHLWKKEGAEWEHPPPHLL